MAPQKLFTWALLSTKLYSPYIFFLSIFLLPNKYLKYFDVFISTNKYLFLIFGVNNREAAKEHIKKIDPQNRKVTI
jgi:hypothetical protein